MSTRRVILGTLIAALVSMLFAHNVNAQSVSASATPRSVTHVRVQAADDEIPPPPSFVLRDTRAAHRPSVFPRVVIETLVGTMSAAGFFYMLAASGESGLGAVGLFGSPFVSTAAVHLVGSGMGSRGSFGWTLAGAGIGVAATTPIALALLEEALQCWDTELCDQEAAEAARVGFIVAIFLGPTIGAVIGHEVSSANAKEDRLRLMPGIAPTRDGQGAILSLAGAF